MIPSAQQAEAGAWRAIKASLWQSQALIRSLRRCLSIEAQRGLEVGGRGREWAGVAHRSSTPQTNQPNHQKRRIPFRNGFLYPTGRLVPWALQTRPHGADSQAIGANGHKFIPRIPRQTSFGGSFQGITLALRS